MHAFSSWLSDHLDKTESEIYLFKMFRIQSLKHIQKININVKLEDIFKTSFQPRCSSRLCFKNSIDNAVDENDFVNNVIKVWSRSRSSRSRSRSRSHSCLFSSLLILIITVFACSKLDDSRRILLSKTHWRLFFDFMKWSLSLCTAGSFTIKKKFIIMIIFIVFISRSMSMKFSFSTNVMIIVKTWITNDLIKRQWKWTWASFKAFSESYFTIFWISWLHDRCIIIL